MGCVRASSGWELAFSEGNCLKAWEVTGISPFTRRVFWKLHKEERMKRRLTEQVQSELPQELNWQNFDAARLWGHY